MRIESGGRDLPSEVMCGIVEDIDDELVRSERG